MDLRKIKISRGWKDLTKEIGIVVVGVLLALVAEQTAQSIERRHKVDAAERAMRVEISQDDGPQAWYRDRTNRCVEAALDDIRTAVETHQSRAVVIKAIMRYHTPFWTWDSLAFASANSSDVALHLPSDTLQRWASAYSVMPTLEAANAKEFMDGAALLAVSRTGDPLSAEEGSHILETVELLRRDNTMIVRGVRVALNAIRAMELRLDSTAIGQFSELGIRYYGTKCMKSE